MAIVDLFNPENLDELFLKVVKFFLKDIVRLLNNHVVDHLLESRVCKRNFVVFDHHDPFLQGLKNLRLQFFGLVLLSLLLDQIPDYIFSLAFKRHEDVKENVRFKED